MGFRLLIDFSVFLCRSWDA